MSPTPVIPYDRRGTSRLPTPPDPEPRWGLVTDTALPVVAVPAGPERVAAALAPIYARGDRWMAVFVGAHALLAVALAAVHATWLAAFLVAAPAAGAFYALLHLRPGTVATRVTAGIALQAFVALHIFQLAGLPEMHFFFFTSITAMILYQDWRAMWPGVWLLIAQHTLWAWWQAQGLVPGGMRFFPDGVSVAALGWHFALVVVQAGIASYAAVVLRRRTLRDAAQRELLSGQAVELVEANRRLGLQASALEAQASALADQTGIAEEARRAAEKANTAKSEFLAVMSHELRTPLNAIGGYTELIEMGLRGPVTPVQLEDLSRIRRSQRHLLSLINDILNFARLEAGQVELLASDVPVDATLAALEELVAPQVAAKGLVLERVGADPALALHADPEKARQVLLNLVTNAIKFTDAGGRIALGARAAGDDAVEVVVRDTGRGIPADRLDSIFEPFVQVDRHLTPAAQQGVGLGLAISRDLARAMGGDLTVESAAGAGAAFTLRLPRAAARAAVPTSAPATATP